MKRYLLSIAAIIGSSLLLAACSDDDTNTEPTVFTVPENPVVIDGSATEYRVEVTCDASWTWELTSTDVDWLEVDRDNDFLVLETQVNRGKEPREALVTLKSGSKTIPLEIIQNRRMGQLVQVSADLGVVITSMSPDGRYFGAYDSDESNLIVDWNTQEIKKLDGGINAFTANGLAVGAVNGQPAIYDIDNESWTTLAMPSIARSGAAGVVNSDGTVVVGHYNFWDETEQAGVDRPIKWENGNLIEMECYESSETYQTYPRSITDDGNFITGDNNAGFACYWINGTISDYLKEEMYKWQDNIFDTLPMGHIWELDDLVIFSTPGYISPNGKYVIGILEEKELATYDGGKTFTRTGVYTFTPYIYTPEDGNIRYLEQFKEESTWHLPSTLFNAINNKGEVFLGQYLYEYETDKATHVNDWVKEEYGINFEAEAGFVALGYSEDRNMFVFVTQYGVGTKCELIYVGY